MEKERLDVLLVKRGLFESREKARSSIMAGVVFVDKKREDKPGTKFPEACEIDIKENINPYVSRGGLKLEKALKTFGISLEAKSAIDIGASTGGFTDCMLKNGAVSVVAVDVGYGQLAWELRNDPRVRCMEKTNIRYVKLEDIGAAVDFGSIDVSFISLTKVIPVAKELTNGSGELVCLIKPQFEAGKDKVGKNGVVRDPEAHREVIEKIIDFTLTEGFYMKGITYSPIKGPEGNIEYLLYISKKEPGLEAEELGKLVSQTVDEAHTELLRPKI
ncbi:MAG: TlyA family RNA methyltransferase [Clostridia bacterium]|nr:TlyA family RNA methyltransferase [Clostridia bacterium]